MLSLGTVRNTLSKPFACFLLALLALVPYASSSPFPFKVMGAIYNHSADTRGRNLSVRWYMAAAKRGDVESALFVGNVFYLGFGVPADELQAIAWWTFAADRGNSDAEFLLSQAYCLGNGVAINRTIATEWWRRAANHGNPSARGNPPHACVEPPKYPRLRYSGPMLDDRI
jgi:TPR repeat protein